MDKMREEIARAIYETRRRYDADRAPFEELFSSAAREYLDAADAILALPLLSSVMGSDLGCLPSPAAPQERSMAGAARRHVAPPCDDITYIGKSKRLNELFGPHGPNLHNPDEVAAFMSEGLRVENGDIHGIPYIAVQIAEAADRSFKAAQGGDGRASTSRPVGDDQERADIDGLLDRLIAHGISGITTDDFPVIYRALEAALTIQPSSDPETLGVLTASDGVRSIYVECHGGIDILASLYAAWYKLPPCPLLGVIGGAIQEIQALRSSVSDEQPKAEDRNGGV